MSMSIVTSPSVYLGAEGTVAVPRQSCPISQFGRFSGSLNLVAVKQWWRRNGLPALCGEWREREGERRRKREVAAKKDQSRLLQEHSRHGGWQMVVAECCCAK